MVITRNSDSSFVHHAFRAAQMHIAAEETAVHELGKTHYTKKGRNQKTPIVWLHGGPGGTHKPDGEVFALAQDRRVYCYTQIGGGRSSASAILLLHLKAGKTPTAGWHMRSPPNPSKKSLLFNSLFFSQES